MKNLIFTLFAFSLLSLNQGFAQGVTISFFSENGERFWVVLDGIRQNDDPQTNVEILNVSKSYLKAKVIFEDDKINSVSGTVTTRDVDNKPMNTVYILTRRHPLSGRIGKMRMRISSFEEAPVVKNNMPTKAPTDSQNTISPSQDSKVAASQPMVNPESQNIQVTINIPVIKEEMKEVVTTPEIIETISVQTPKVPVSNKPTQPEMGANSLTQEGTREEEKDICPVLSNSDFDAFMSQVNNQRFENTKLDMAEQLLTFNCLKTSQLKTILQAFSFENTKLDFAKSAYLKTIDQNRYFTINDVFTFSSSISELNEYIKKLPQ